MRHRIFFLLLALVTQFTNASAQRFGYIDSEYIASRMPEFQKANAEMEKWTATKTKEISDKNAEIDRLERAFKAEEPLLTDAMKQQRTKEIATKAQEARDLNNKTFGFEGAYHQKRKELLRPVMDEIYKALEKVARNKQLRVVFDKASEGIAIMYSDPRDDYSDFILEELGLDPKNNETPPQKPKN